MARLPLTCPLFDNLCRWSHCPHRSPINHQEVQWCGMQKGSHFWWHAQWKNITHRQWKFLRRPVASQERTHHLQLKQNSHFLLWQHKRTQSSNLRPYHQRLKSVQSKHLLKPQLTPLTTATLTQYIRQPSLAQVVLPTTTLIRPSRPCTSVRQLTQPKLPESSSLNSQPYSIKSTQVLTIWS